MNNCMWTNIHARKQNVNVRDSTGIQITKTDNFDALSQLMKALLYHCMTYLSASIHVYEPKLSCLHEYYTHIVVATQAHT